VEVSEANISWLQELVDEDLSVFQVSVMRGRKIAPKEMIELSTGASWSARAAKNMGLVDQVALPEDRYDEIEREHAEQFTDLHGSAAVEKWVDVVFERTGHIPARSTTEQLESVAAEYPSLAAAAASANQAQKVTHTPWPRGSTRGHGARPRF
jgi:ClpP class serine protease